MEPDRVSALIPFLHVADVERSIAFYEQLGLEVDDTYEQNGRLVWVSMKSGRAALMLAEAPEPVWPSGGRHFLYTADLAGLRERLIGAGWSRPRSRTVPRGLRGRCRSATRIDISSPSPRSRTGNNTRTRIR